MTEPLLSAQQAGELLGLSVDGVYRLCRAGKLTHYRLGMRGGSLKVKASDVAAYVESCRVEAGARRGHHTVAHLHVRPRP